MLSAILLLAAAGTPPPGFATAIDLAELGRAPLVVFVHQQARPVACCVTCRWDRLETEDRGPAVVIFHLRGCEFVRTAAIAGHPSPARLHAIAHPEVR